MISAHNHSGSHLICATASIILCRDAACGLPSALLSSAVSKNEKPCLRQCLHLPYPKMRSSPCIHLGRGEPTYHVHERECDEWECDGRECDERECDGRECDERECDEWECDERASTYSRELARKITCFLRVRVEMQYFLRARVRYHARV